MHLSTPLDCDLVAVESTDELTLLVELTAPVPPATAIRAAATLKVVLDRSGWMAGDRLEGAKSALLSLVDRLDPTDNLGIVAFDDAVQLVVPAGPLTDKARVKAAIRAVTAGGLTDLSAGYLRGLQEATRVVTEVGATVLLVSDGHANAGMTVPEMLGRIAAEAQSHRIISSTLGFGLGYDEQLLAAVAQGGAGNELFAEGADTAAALIAGEVDGLLDQVAQACSLRVRWADHVAGAHVLNDVPLAALPDGFVIELGTLYAGETRRLLLRLDIPGIPALGLTEVARLDFTHVRLPDLVQHTTSVPVLVNVVPGDQAAGRIPDPEVRSEALLQQTQQAKRRSSRLLSEGLVDDAARVLRRAGQDLRAGLATAPPSLAPELAREAELLESPAEEAAHNSARAAKVGSFDASMKSRSRGRRSPGGRFLLRWRKGHELDASAAMLVLDEWELVRLQREAPSVASVRSAAGDHVADEVAARIAEELPRDHPCRRFFLGAALNGGVHRGARVSRAAPRSSAHIMSCTHVMSRQRWRQTTVSVPCRDTARVGGCPLDSEPGHE